MFSFSSDGAYTVAASCNLSTRFVSSSAVQASVSVQLSSAVSAAVDRLSAFAAVVGALFSQQPRSFLLLDLRAVNASKDGARSLLTFAVKNWPIGQAQASSFVQPKALREKLFLQTAEIQAKSGLKVNRPTSFSRRCDYCIAYFYSTLNSITFGKKKIRLQAINFKMEIKIRYCLSTDISSLQELMTATRRFRENLLFPYLWRTVA